MSSDKPTLWISRKLSANTEARAQQNYNVILNPDDTLSTGDDLIPVSYTHLTLPTTPYV